VKTKLQTQIFATQLNPNFVPKYATVLACTKHLIREYYIARYVEVPLTVVHFVFLRSGVKSLWQGLTATIIRNIPANALFFPGI